MVVGSLLNLINFCLGLLWTCVYDNKCTLLDGFVDTNQGGQSLSDLISAEWCSRKRISFSPLIIILIARIGGYNHYAVM